MKNLTKPEDQQIFSFGAQRFHPYASSSSVSHQFHIPISIDAGDTNKHGQLQALYLDQIFHYVAVDTSNGQISFHEPISEPHLSTRLKKWLASRFMERDLFDAQYQYFKKCSDNGDKKCSNDVKDFECRDCVDNFEKLQTQKKDWFDQGLGITSLDNSIALIFGTKTTIGQVCSFVKGLRDGTVVDVPGFCCLDAPYSSSDWGEKVR